MAFLEHFSLTQSLHTTEIARVYIAFRYSIPPSTGAKFIKITPLTHFLAGVARLAAPSVRLKTNLLAHQSKSRLVRRWKTTCWRHNWCQYWCQFWGRGKKYVFKQKIEIVQEETCEDIIEEKCVNFEVQYPLFSSFFADILIFCINFSSIFILTAYPQFCPFICQWIANIGVIVIFASLVLMFINQSTLLYLSQLYFHIFIMIDMMITILTGGDLNLICACNDPLQIAMLPLALHYYTMQCTLQQPIANCNATSLLNSTYSLHYDNYDTMQCCTLNNMHCTIVQCNAHFNHALLNAVMVCTLLIFRFALFCTGYSFVHYCDSEQTLLTQDSGHLH